MALAALWGASYLFIKIGLDDLSPAGVVFIRTALAALVLLPFAIKSGGMAPLWRRAPWLFALAAMQVAGTMSASALMTLPLMLIDLPSHLGLDTIGAMSALGLGGTGIAFVIYYTLNHAIGPTRTSLVAYIAPVFALVYGVTLLDERFR